MTKKLDSPVWAGEKRLYERLYYAIVSRKTRIIDIVPPEDDLGYTAADGLIHLAYHHQTMTGMDTKTAAVFRYGVFVHEMLHQIFSDFQHLDAVCGACTDKTESRVTALFANLVEDPAIEYFAPTWVGGEMVESLRFMIRHLHTQAKPLEESTSAFAQLANALIMFGDVGLIKGRFTFPEAEKYFKMLLPEFNRMVTCPDAAARIDAARKWAVLTRPLWKKEEKESEDLLQKTLDEMLAQKGASGNGTGTGRTNSSGGPNTPPETEDEERSETAKRRSEFAEAVEEEAASGASGAKEESGEQGESGQTGTEEKSAIERFTESAGMPKGQPPQDVINSLWEQIAQEARECESSDEDTLDLPVHIPKATLKSGKEPECLNRRTEPNGELRAAYADIRERVGRDARLLTARLRNVMRTDYDEDTRSTSGRYNIKRGLTQSTVKVFDKRRERKSIEDTAVMILVDQSASMRGKKITLAQDTTIMLAETFAALKIPCYIMGFTADDEKDVVHDHYVSWKNTPEERITLAGICARNNNDDGYSIRYSAALLSKKQVRRRILFVISDGAPACLRYAYTDGVTDTSLAIKEASRTATVYGIGIGMTQSERLAAMYKGLYISIHNVSELPTTLAKHLGRIVARI